MVKRFLALLLCLALPVAAIAEEAAADDAAVDGEKVIGALEVRLGEGADSDERFVLSMYDNDTAVALYRNMSSGWLNKPLNYLTVPEYEDVLQYYTIPRSYTIPKAETALVTEEKAGELYYSNPNRVYLFVEDAQLELELIKVGSVETVPDFATVIRKDVAVLKTVIGVPVS